MEGFLPFLTTLVRPGSLQWGRLFPGLVFLACLNLTPVSLAQGSDPASSVQQINDLLQKGRTAEAIAVGQKALNSVNQNKATSEAVHVDVAKALAIAYFQMGDLADGVAVLKEEARKLEAQGSRGVGVAEMYQMLASPCGQLGGDAEAEDAAAHAVELFESQLMPDDLRIANALYTQSIQERALRNSVEELHALKRALRIASTATPSYMSAQTRKNVLFALATFYENSAPERSADYRAQALSLSTDSLGKGGLPDDYTNAGEIGMAAMRDANFPKAALAFQRQLDISVRLFGQDSEGAKTARIWLARSYLGQKERGKAKPFLVGAVESLYTEYQHDFPLMNEGERLQFADSAEVTLGLFCSYVHQFHSVDSELAGMMYDLALWSKGAAFTTARSVQDSLRNTKDPDLQRLRETLDDQKTRYRDATASNSPAQVEDRISVLALESQILVKLRLPPASRITWQMIRRKLAAGDVAIEILRYHYTDGPPSSTVYYSALILRPEWDSPRYVYLGTDIEIENQEMPLYLLYATSKLGSPPPILDFWNRLESEFGTRATRIFVSPDGILANVSFLVLPDQNHAVLIDKYDVRTVVSTGDLLSSAVVASRSNLAVLVGDPQFTLSLKDASLPMDERGNVTAASAAGLGGQAKKWTDLHETSSQIDSVAAGLRRHNWNVETLKGAQATRERVMLAARQPRVLHFATHGFFSDQGKGQGYSAFRADNDMLASGLVLAGANSDDNPQRALLTSYDISSLDLTGTELVVLSACDTGLADTLTGGEVFGLRRAFQIAGADAVMMTMWKVPEKETSDIVTDFYERWMDGVDKHSALLAAQRKARGANRPPYFWGAFVLVER
jgi:CHAT domain-containing protein